MNFEIYDVTNWTTNNFNTISQEIKPINNIWNKANQSIKFDQWIECRMRNIFLENLYAKCREETSPRPLSKKLKLGISLD